MKYDDETEDSDYVEINYNHILLIDEKYVYIYH
jgi:hypothetical protein